MSVSQLCQLHQRIAACRKCTELSNHSKFPPECHGTTRFGIMLVSEGAYLPSIQAGRYFTRGNLRDAIPNLEEFCYLTDVIKCDSSCGKSENLAQKCFPYLAEEMPS
jgi:uracil-DNA glycosylase